MAKKHPLLKTMGVMTHMTRGRSIRFPDFWYSWRHQLPGLVQAGYRVVCPDLRGYGRSSKPSRLDAYSERALVADVGFAAPARGHGYDSPWFKCPVNQPDARDASSHYNDVWLFSY